MGRPGALIPLLCFEVFIRFVYKQFDIIPDIHKMEECQVCEKSFTEKEALRRHLEKGSCKGAEEVKTKLDCPSCTRTFSKLSNLTRHLREGVCGQEKKNLEKRALEEQKKNLECQLVTRHSPSYLI